MPLREILSLDVFQPDEAFDPQEDLIAITCADQNLYASYINGVWGVRLEDPTMSPSMLEMHRAQEQSLPRSPGLRIDEAKVGSFVLLSAAGYDWRGIWRTEQSVSGLTAVRRTEITSSDAVIVENRK